MNYYLLVALMVAAVILMCCLFSRIRVKVGRRTFMAGGAVLCCLLLLSSVGNLFITFPSAEKAYEAITHGDTNVELVVEGNECDLIVDVNVSEGYHRIHFIPKTSNGWKASILSGVEYVVDLFYQNGAAISVFKYRFSEDYFVCIDKIQPGESVVFDSCGSEFLMVSMEKPGYENGQISYYAHIVDIASPYWVEIDGRRIDLKIQYWELQFGSNNP